MRYFVIVDDERPDPAEPWSIFRTPDAGGPPMELLDPLSGEWQDTPALVSFFAGVELGAYEVSPTDAAQVISGLLGAGEAETKRLEHVRTAEGAAHFREPIGSVITVDEPIPGAAQSVAGDLLVPSTEGMRKASELDRKRLKVPPAWTDVTVAADPEAPLQCRAKDGKGRPKALYTDAFHAQQAALKFDRIRALHDKLPNLDTALAADAKSNDTAAAVLLIRRMGLRPGSMNDTKADVQAYGATTLLVSHVVWTDSHMHLTFVGKEGKHLDFEVHDPELAVVIAARCAGKKPGDRLFSTNEGKALAYIKQHTGEHFKTKDLRTYHANALALAAMAHTEGAPPKTLAEFKKMRKAVAVEVSAELGNEPAMALKAYINPAVFTRWYIDPSWSAA